MNSDIKVIYGNNIKIRIVNKFEEVNQNTLIIIFKKNFS